MKILQIVEESPSLDFTIPIFDQIHEENEIIIFTIRPTYNYWFDHKPEKLFPENNTNVIFLDLIKISKFPRIVTKFFRLFVLNNRDNTNNFLSKSLRVFFTYLLDLSSDIQKIFDNFSDNGFPDIVMVDSRNDLKINNINKKLFTLINNKKIKTIGVPVSTYVREGWFFPVNLFGTSSKLNFPFNKLPNKFEFWSTTYQPKTKDQLEKNQYRIVGYSGLNENWLSKWTGEKKENVKEIKILLNIRHFDEDIGEQNKPGPYTADEVEKFFSFLSSLQEELKDYKIEFILKPHYYMNFESLNKLLINSKIKNTKTFRTSIYNSLKNVDIVVGLHTSVNIVTSAAKIPTILYPETQTKIIGETDKKTSEMYTSHPGYAESKEEFKNLFIKSLDIESRNKLGKECYLWSKKIFGDTSMKNIISQINKN